MQTRRKVEQEVKDQVGRVREQEVRNARTRNMLSAAAAAAAAAPCPPPPTAATPALCLLCLLQAKAHAQALHAQRREQAFLMRRAAAAAKQRVQTLQNELAETHVQRRARLLGHGRQISHLHHELQESRREAERAREGQEESRRQHWELALEMSSMTEAELREEAVRQYALATEVSPGGAGSAGHDDTTVLWEPT